MRPRDRVLRRLQLRGPDRLGIVLDVAGPRKDLRELLLCRRDRPARSIEDDGAAGRRALVEGEMNLLIG
jgi:hypothetical protein